jgi:2-(1,2-epoxy-1,2-dihydrophenyl)acetyl-CoA isomerase
MTIGTDKTPPTVLLEIRDGVAFVTLSRPEAANSMDLAFGRDILKVALSLEANETVRAVMLSGAGKNFCFGGDLKGMVASGGDVTEYLTLLTKDLHAAIVCFTRMRAPVIAAVTGTAAGAGVGLVLMADLAIAGASAKFAPAYTGVALTPDGSTTFLLPRAVGYKRAMELFLTNRVLSASEALEWGLVNQVVDDAVVLETATALAGRLAAGPTAAFGQVKHLLNASEPGLAAQLDRESHTIAKQGASAEGREGIGAFLEKRKPTYSAS